MYFLTLWMGLHLQPKDLQMFHTALNQTPESGWINISHPSSLLHNACFIHSRVNFSVYQKADCHLWSGSSFPAINLKIQI